MVEERARSINNIQEFGLMSFQLLMFTNDDRSFKTLENLENSLTTYFSFDKSVKISIVNEEFVGEFVRMSWDSWDTDIFLEENSQETEENNYIFAKSKEVLNNLGGHISDKRLRVIFWDDEDKVYTDKCIDIVDFLTSLKNTVIYDVQKENIFKWG
jgi:hypothetical protein